MRFKFLKSCIHGHTFYLPTSISLCSSLLPGFHPHHSPTCLLSMFPMAYKQPIPSKALQSSLFVILQYFTQFNTSATFVEFCDTTFSRVSSTILAVFSRLLCKFILYLVSQFQGSQAPVFHDFLSLYSSCVWFTIHFKSTKVHPHD